MALTAGHFQPYLGRPIVVHSSYGMHTGILHEIRPDGIVLRNARMVQTSSAQGMVEAQTADRPDSLQAEEAFWPFFFLPFLALAAFSPWFWW
ncbi:YuzF family protein [Fodinisporobacter ferrooxydans]|uniref:YuzF family protein n=1 Tax=Fodinisporobacter ferrooxydans TaxID=2901836 RepID=A0ABY4CHG7_9BACL|nr:YuzF family protein [Alicyclobacillaceae bacterium MYW30-H2]